jgi:hypothetical protein
MRYRYRLPERLKESAFRLEEFANGGAQCHVRLRSGLIQEGVLVSNSTAIVAMRGQKDLPFAIDDIEELFQTDDDRSPTKRGDWSYFDDWS